MRRHAGGMTNYGNPFMPQKFENDPGNQIWLISTSRTIPDDEGAA